MLLHIFDTLILFAKILLENYVIPSIISFKVISIDMIGLIKAPISYFVLL